MTKPEANAVLCRELGVEPIPHLAPRHDFWLHDGTGPVPCSCGAEFGDGPKDEACPNRLPTYPDLTDANVLLSALRRTATITTLTLGDCRVSLQMATLRPGETHGSMLFRAACAAFGIVAE